MDRAAIFDELWATRNVITPEEAIRFINAVEQLELGDNTLLPDILYIFQDDANIDPFKYLANLVASLDNALVIKYLVERAPDIINVAKEWLSLLYITLLNEDLGNEWINNLRQSSASVRSVVFELFDEIEQEISPIEPMSGDEETLDAKLVRVITMIRAAFPAE